MSDPYLTAVGLIGDRDLTEDVLHEVIQTLTMLPAFKAADLDVVRKQLEASIGIRMTAGAGLTDGENLPWVDDVKATVDWHYWDSYLTQLKSDGFPKAVIRTLDEDTDNVLTECGNPKNQASWKIQGLVMGDVQSGKTANYCGLITKAADAGYKIVVLLTGMIEELRAQSQERMDEGFVGRDSRKLISGQAGSAKIGAGRFRNIFPNVLTSIDSDFLTANQGALRGIPLANIQQPVLLVMKKNKAALGNLLIFLNQQMARGVQQLDLPLLLVDDEADNASVNAKKDEDPATINRLIREVLAKFRQSSYVAYTATPFANVFINPDSSDLFPKNFVYSLNTPSNYIGVSSVFSDEGSHSGQIVDLDDALDVFPEKHTKELQVEGMPKSMEEAVGVFLLSCAIRDIRGERLKHRSMLVNVTRFTQVQGRLAEVVKAHLYAVVDEVKQYMADSELWYRHPTLVELKSWFDLHYHDAAVDWDQVRAKLYEAILSIKVVTINQATDMTERLNYRAYKNQEKGRRVIAIGGLTLSRGLTLEGLSVSYFFRNSKAYDTLLQMGRWFGYRTDYSDLCRIWIAPEAQSWFSHIAGVVTELRGDIRRMHANKQPPSRFGMRVQSHPGALMVTAGTKMRNSKEVVVELSFSGYAAETAFLPKRRNANDRNLERTAAFLTSIGPAKAEGSRFRWVGIPAERIADLLGQLEISPMNSAFIGSVGSPELPLVRFVRESAAALGKWDVCVPQGEGTPTSALHVLGPAGSEVQTRPRKRQFERPTSKSADYLKLNKQRVGEIADEQVGLTSTEIEEAEQRWREDKGNDGKVPSGKAYRNVRKRPLLTIHAIEPTDPKDKDAKNAKRILETSAIEPRLLVALSISFPLFEGGASTSVTYRLNKVSLQQLGLAEAEADDEDQD